MGTDQKYINLISAVLHGIALGILLSALSRGLL